jgi:hypothetical protein
MSKRRTAGIYDPCSTNELFSRCCLKCTYKGQFIVSRKSILRNPKKQYQDLFDVLTARPFLLK